MSFNVDLEAGFPPQSLEPCVLKYNEKCMNNKSYDSLLSLYSELSSLDEKASSLSSTQSSNAVIADIQRTHIVPYPPLAQSVPPKKGTQHYRNFRWILFTTYRRLFTLAFTVNVAILIGLAARKQLNSSNTATAAAVNLIVSILMRQEHVINLLFVLASCLPTSLPLSLRCYVAKVYCYGGVHSGCGIAAAAWYIAFTTYLTQASIVSPGLWPASGCAYAVLLLLVLIVGSAHPYIRTRMHNQFEATHRFAGWVVIAVYWAQIMVLVNQQARDTLGKHSFGIALVNTPSFWCVCILTACLFYPWIRLRYRTVLVEKLSDHVARLHFTHSQVGRCIGVRLSTDPLLESHAFATIPAERPGRGFSCVVSNAGDWTKGIIREPVTRTKIWMKGAPVYGVLRTALIFKRTVIVATGSGIGPCLSLLNDNDDIDCRVLWSTKAPFATYGQRICDAVRRADPNATVLDSSKMGRPDMVWLTYQLYKASGAEAVFLISNPVVTRKVIYGLESRGVPAFAPIFDS